MKKIVLTLMMALLFMGCSKNSEAMKNVEPKLVVGKSLASLKLNDQNEKPLKLTFLKINPLLGGNNS